MAHQRQTIREAVKAQLLGKTAAGSRVYESRMVPWRRVELPGIAVYSLEENIDPESRLTAPRELTRTLQLLVVGVVKATSNVDDLLDDMSSAIEKAVDADPTFGGAAGDSILSSVQIGVDEEGQEPLGVLQLTFSVTYRTDAPAAADLPALDDFTTANVKTDLSGTTHPGNQSEDRIAVPAT